MTEHIRATPMTKQLVFPPRLRKGDTIGLFCPSGPVRDIKSLQAGIRLIEHLGFAVKLCGQHTANKGYLADTDEQRAAHLHALWSDAAVKALLSIRGGYGCLRMIGLLDWELFRQQPKLLVGFSDVTVLLNALINQVGILAIHGPMATTLTRSGEQGIASLFGLLTGDFDEQIKVKGLEILRGGIGRGRLVGGNLTTLVHLLASPWESTWDGCILVLEDTGEAVYRLDRILTHLALAGRLDRLAGLILGDFDLGDEPLTNLRLQESVWSRVLELAPPGYPIWARFPVGHRARNLALPLGMDAIMASDGVLHLLTDSVELA